MAYEIDESWIVVPSRYDGTPIPANTNVEISCNWHDLCDQLVQQWSQITLSDLEQTGHNRRDVARLIQKKYGVSLGMAENYLCNFERTLPLLGGVMHSSF